MREKLASEVHEIWSHWMKHLLTLGKVEGFEFKIPLKHVKRWRRQIRTPWDALPDEEQGSDLEMADRIIQVIGEELSIEDLTIVQSKGESK